MSTVARIAGFDIPGPGSRSSGKLDKVSILFYSPNMRFRFSPSSYSSSSTSVGGVIV